MLRKLVYFTIPIIILLRKIWCFLYRHAHIPFNKYNYDENYNELNILHDIALKKKFNLNTISNIKGKIKASRY